MIWSVQDPVTGKKHDTMRQCSSVLKLLRDILSQPALAQSFFFQNDRQALVDVVMRDLEQLDVLGAFAHHLL